MPIDIDIREHEVLGPMLKEAEQRGFQEGFREGFPEGLREGLLTILRRKMGSALAPCRFGPPKNWRYCRRPNLKI